MVLILLEEYGLPQQVCIVIKMVLITLLLLKVNTGWSWIQLSLWDQQQIP